MTNLVVGKIEQLTQEPAQPLYPSNFSQVLGESILRERIKDLEIELAKFKKILPHKPFLLKRYDSIEEVRAASWGLTVEEFMDCDEEQEAYDLNGNKVEGFTFAQELQNLKSMGYWGFVHVEKDQNTIHVWYDEKAGVTLEELIHFFGHEIGHATGTNINGDEDDVEAYAEEEKRADSYGEVANLAFKFANQLLQIHKSLLELAPWHNKKRINEIKL